MLSTKETVSYTSEDWKEDLLASPVSDSMHLYSNESKTNIKEKHAQCLEMHIISIIENNSYIF